MKYDLTHEDARLNKWVPLLNQLNRGSLGQNLPKRFQIDTVDGRNPGPVDMENPPLFTGFCTSQVVQDFFHQQYHHKNQLYDVICWYMVMFLSHKMAFIHKSLGMFGVCVENR